jgi:large subunit ribosomal protein L24
VAKRAEKAKMKIKKGDRVVVVAGKDKGVTGKVIQAFPAEGKLLVEGVNRVTKHVKVGQTARGAKTGGIVHTEAKIDVSNVMLAVEVEVDGETRVVGTRVGYRIDPETGMKVRVAKRTGEDI